MDERVNSVEHWLERLSRNTAKVHLKYFRRWLAWLGEHGGELAGLSPNGLVEFQDNAQSKRERFLILDALQRWVGRLNLRVSSKRRAQASVRSFFLRNRSPLPRDPDFNLRREDSKPRVVGSLTFDEFRMILAGCSPCYQAVFLCMFQGGMGKSELVYWSDYGKTSLLSQLRHHMSPIRVDLPGRKRARNERPYYTFIGSDAVEALETYLEKAPRDAETIFLNQYGRPLNAKSIELYWGRKIHRLGLVKKPNGADGSTRYGKSPHELRDLFRTRWQKSGADPVAAEFFMGHTVDPLEYNKVMRDVDYARAQYFHAERWLSVRGGDHEMKSVFEMAKMEADIRREFENKLDEQRRMIEELRESIRLYLKARRLGLEP